MSHLEPTAASATSLSLEHVLRPAHAAPLRDELSRSRLAAALFAGERVLSFHFVIPRGERTLLTCLECGGSAESAFAELAERAPEPLDAVFSHCEGYPSAGASDAHAFAAFALAGRIDTPFRFVAHPDASLRRLRRALDWFDKTLEFQRQLAKPAPETLRAQALSLGDAREGS